MTSEKDFNSRRGWTTNSALADSSCNRFALVSSMPFYFTGGTNGAGTVRNKDGAVPSAPAEADSTGWR